MKLSQMKLNRLLVTTLAGSLSATAALAQDDAAKNGDPDIQTLKSEIQQLEQKVDVLEYQQGKDHKAVTLAATNSAHLTVGSDGVIFTSANSNFVAGVHGLVQVDSRTFFQNGATPGIDGFLLRRARLILSGTVYKNFDYNLTTEFGGSTVQILDAYLNYKYRPEVQIQIGKFKPPVGLEQLQSDVNLFFNERSLATVLVPNRDIGAELHGDVFGGALTYATGIFNGLPDYNSTTINANYNNDMAFAGRLFATPFKQTSIAPLQGLGFGVSGSYEEDDDNTTAGLTPGYTTDGQEKFFTYAASTAAQGAHWRVSPNAYYYYGPLGILGEYVVSDQQVVKTTAPTASGDLHNTAWEVAAGWVLTGESDSYNGVNPKHPFDIRNGGWGAWQVVGRYEELSVDGGAFPNFAAAQTTTAAAAQGARAWSAGLNWYLNKNLRANVSFSHTWFNGNTTGVNLVTQRPENVLFTRVQLAF